MRLPLATNLDSRDGALDKDARMTNALKDVRNGTEIVTNRPGLLLAGQVDGVAGQGITSHDGDLIAIYGGNIELFTEGSLDRITPLSGMFVPHVISEDGEIVVGIVVSDTLSVWTSASGIVSLGTIGTSNVTAHAISANNEAIVGHYGPGSARGGFYWSQPTGLIDIGDLGGSTTDLLDLTGNGTMAVGYSSMVDDIPRAIKWTLAGGIVELGMPVGYDENTATFVSHDGTVIAGDGLTYSPFLSKVFRWTQAEGAIDIGTLGGDDVRIYDLSYDGSTIVGSANDSLGNYFPYKWTKSGGIVSLGTLDGTAFPHSDTMAIAVSGDGSVIVGGAMNSQEMLRAFRWTELGGMENLGVIDGYAFSRAYYVSRDGKVIIGTCVGDLGTIMFRWTRLSGMVAMTGTSGDVIIDEFEKATPDCFAITGRDSIGAFRAKFSKFERISSITPIPSDNEIFDFAIGL